MRRYAMGFLLALFVGGCQGSPPAKPPVGTAATTASSATVTTPPLPPDPLASLRARGALHGDPIRIPASGKLPERWLAFLGTPEQATVAWYVTPGDPKNELAPVERWPAGARALGGVVRDGVPFVLLESVSLLDQPAGMYAVWFDSTAGAAGGGAFAGVRDVAELGRRVEALAPVPARATSDGASLLATVRAAGQSDVALARALPAEGADVVEVWQRLFTRTLEHLDAGRVGSSARKEQLLAILRDAASDERCSADACETDTPTGTATVLLGQVAGRFVVRGFRIDAAPPPTVSGTPRAVTAASSTAATEATLREHVRATRTILGEAPLYGAVPNDATIGVALTDLECDGPAVVLRDGAFTRVFPLSSLCMAGAKLSGARFEARFADVDGDGRTDAIVRVAGRTGPDAGLDASLTRAYLAPPPTVQREELVADFGSDLALLGAQSIDDAVKAALAVPSRGTNAKDACRVLAGTSTVQGFRRSGAADVRVLFFEEHAMPTYLARVVPERALQADDVRLSGSDCPELDCSETRPYCESGDGDAFYWFTWIGGKMRLAGAAFSAGGLPD